LIQLVFVGVDVLIAIALMEIVNMWQLRMKRLMKVDQKKSEFQLLDRKDLPELAALLYLLNPFTVVNCVGMSTLSFTNLAIVGSLYFALKGNQTLMTFSLAASCYLSIYPATLIMPLSLLLSKRSLLSNSLMTAMWFTGLLYLSYSMLNSWDFLMDTFGFNMAVTDLSPNIGLFWYFFTEVFKHYRLFYLFAYQYHAFFYSIPLYLRLRDHPMFLFWINVAIMACFKSYPSVGDLAIQMAFIPLIFDKVRENRYGFVILIAALFVTLLAPIFWLMWIYLGTGNANFYYAINLVSTMAQVLFITNSLSVVLKNEYLERKQEKDALNKNKINLVS